MTKRLGHFFLLVGLVLAFSTGVAKAAPSTTQPVGPDDADYQLGVEALSKQDYQRSFDLFLKAAEVGNSDAMYNVGMQYDNGQGVHQDTQQAFEWYQKAAALGVSDAMFSVGYDYEHAIGVAQNYQQAMAWYQKAAALGDSNAMVNIGTLYDIGQGIPQDDQQAMAWWQ